MKLETPKETPFNWIKGYEGIYLMNEEKQIKTSRVTVISNNKKKEKYESKFIKPYFDENQILKVDLINIKGKKETHTLNDLEVIKYKRDRKEPKT